MFFKKALPIYLGFVLTGTAYANSSFTVSFDTSGLMGSAAGPFTLNFQLTDGSGSDDGNNSVTLANFTLGGGSLQGVGSSLGNVSGDLSNQLAMTDDSFFTEFQQQFIPGSSLSFSLDLTNNVDSGGIPDQFSFLILDSSNTPIPTLGFSDFANDVLLAVVFDSISPTPLVYATDPGLHPLAGGDPIVSSPPTLNPIGNPPPSTVPLPGSVSLLLLGIAILGRMGLLRIIPKPLAFAVGYSSSVNSEQS